MLLLLLMLVLLSEEGVPVAASWLACVVGTASLVFADFVDPDARVVRIRGMILPNLPGVSRLEGHLASWLCSLRLRRGDWCTCNNNCRREMSFVVWLTMPSQCPHDALIVFVGKAALWHRGGLLPWPPSLRLRCLSCKALVPLVKNNVDSARCDQWQWCNRLLLLVENGPSSDAFVAFKARFC